MKKVNFPPTPILGKVYRLTYLSNKTERGHDIVSDDFTYMYKRRSGYYFLSTKGVIDLVIKPYLFSEYLNNTVDKLANR